MVRGVEHLALCSADVSALVAWYRELLRLEVIREGEEGPYFLRFPDGFLLEVIESSDDTSAIPGEREKGFRHIALSVSSIETLITSLKQKGVVVVEDLKLVPGGAKLFLFRDIEGNLVQLVERKIAIGD
jgi:catechol 2,3-dioxygenase-like lactoylglutathione lyase family enzyme